MRAYLKTSSLSLPYGVKILGNDRRIDNGISADSVASSSFWSAASYDTSGSATKTYMSVRTASIRSPVVALELSQKNLWSSAKIISLLFAGSSEQTRTTSLTASFGFNWSNEANRSLIPSFV